MTAPNQSPQPPQPTPFNKLYNKSCVYTDVIQLTCVYTACTIHTSYCTHPMHCTYVHHIVCTPCIHWTIRHHIYVVYASHVLCVLVLTWVNRILSNNSEVSCWSLVMSALWCIPNTSGSGVMGRVLM